ncbi:MAG: response regulator transcription factor, partial [bacterium]
MTTEIVHIVDDDEGAVKPIVKLVETIGLQAETYQSSEDFLNRYRSSGPACLVLDVRMPEMSGVTLQERLAENGVTMPIIMISAYADVPLAVQAMRNGALNFLEKPFRLQE